MDHVSNLSGSDLISCVIGSWRATIPARGWPVLVEEISLLRMFANKLLLLFTCLLDTIIVVSLVHVLYLGLYYTFHS